MTTGTVTTGMATTRTVPPPPTAPPAEARRFPPTALALATVAGLLTLLSRLPRLGRPAVLVFDEVFYAGDAADLLVDGVVQGRPAHPPLGTMMIAAGVRLFGFDPFGWRVVPLLAGAVTVGLTVLLAVRLTGSLRAGALAGLIVATDGIAFVTGRVALLDGLVALWSTAAVLVLAGAASHPSDGPAHRRAAWQVAVLIGLALAVKWSSALLAPLAAVVLVLLDLAVFPAGDGEAPRRRRRRRWLGTLSIVFGVTISVYGLAHVPWLVHYERTDRAVVTCGDQCGLGDRIGGLVDRHREVLEFHRDLRPDGRYVGSSLTWVAQSRPTGLFVEDCGTSAVTEVPAGTTSDGICAGASTAERASVLAAGNPFVWLLGAGATVVAIVVGLRRRDWPAVVVAVATLTYVVPWLLDRPAFSFYAAPVVPLMAAVLAWTVARWVPPRGRAVSGAVIAAAAVLGLVWSWPLLTGVPLSNGVADVLGTWPGWSP